MPIATIGKLNEWITFYKKIKQKDNYGTVLNDPAIKGDKVLSCWCMIKTQFLNEIKASVGTVLENSVTFVIRHQQSQTITNDMLIEHSGIQYEIIAINPDMQFKQYDTVIAKAVE